jgi:hypothetical protein
VRIIFLCFADKSGSGVEADVQFNVYNVDKIYLLEQHHLFIVHGKIGIQSAKKGNRPRKRHPSMIA